MSRIRPRVGLIFPYWSFWETSAGGPAFRAGRQETLVQAEETLSSAGIDVVISALVDSVESGEQFAISIADAGVEAIVVAQTMAVPPAFAMAALDRKPELPVVVWALQLVD